MEWVLSRLVEARYWAQYAVRRGATTSSVTKFSAAILSFKQGHQVTEDCQSEDLIKLREEGLWLLDRLKQITLAWVSLWKNVASGQGEEEHFQQMEEGQLEEAGMQVSAELDEWEVNARECIDTALKQNAIETRARWSEWVIAALEGGARRAHAFSKTPVPDPVQQIHSVKDASQVANTSVLAAEKKKLQKLWQSHESSSVHRIALAQRACLPALAPDTIRRAAREISTHTATSTDGFAMRHFALLSDDALMLASQLFECMELLGTIPQQLRYVLVVLIPKATTGLRPIGIFCALYRLWAKCRTIMAQSWEILNPRPYFAASKGRAVTDPIWRHAVAVECGVGQGDETVSVWRDFAQFYERMEHHILQANAEMFGFPLPVLRVAVSAYKMQRVLVLHGEAAPTGYPSRGVVAGCAIATYLVKLYCLPVLDSVVRLHPRVSLDVFIDDSPVSPGNAKGSQETHRGCWTNLHRGSPKTVACPFCRQKDSDRLVPSETGVERSSTIGAAEGGSPNPNSRPGGRCERWKNSSRHLSKKEEEDTKSRQEKSQTANADEAREVAGAKDLQMWPACTGMKSQASLVWSGDPCSAWPRRRTVR